MGGFSKSDTDANVSLAPCKKDFPVAGILTIPAGRNEGPGETTVLLGEQVKKRLHETTNSKYFKWLVYSFKKCGIKILNLID
jgi:hypothetical protein